MKSVIRNTLAFGTILLLAAACHHGEDDSIAGMEAVTYQASDAVIANPERGFYSSQEIHSASGSGISKEGAAIKNTTFPDTESFRKAAVERIHAYRVSQSLGVVARFDPDTYNDTIWFSRFGEGSLGGKARGLAFLNHILYKHSLYEKW